MSRSNPSRNKWTSTDEPYKDIPESRRYYIGRDKPNIAYSRSEPLHWWEAYKLGYRPKAWPKDDRDRDDIRYDLKEKE